MFMLISFKHVDHFLQIIMALPQIKYFHRYNPSITVVRHQQIHLYRMYALLYKWTMSGSSRKGIFCCTSSNICNRIDVNPPRMVISREVTSLVVWEMYELMQGCWDKSNSQHYSKPDMTTNSNLAVIRQSKIARDWLNLTRSGTGSNCKCTTHTLCSLRQKWRKRT